MLWKIGLVVAVLIAVAFSVALCKIAAESDRRMREMFGKKTGE